MCNRNHATGRYYSFSGVVEEARTFAVTGGKTMGFLGMKSKAEKTEAAILARLSGQEGVTVLLPFGGGNGRYDMVIDDNGTFYRIQYKTGRMEQW